MEFLGNRKVSYVFVTDLDYCEVSSAKNFVANFGIRDE